MGNQSSCTTSALHRVSSIQSHSTIYVALMVDQSRAKIVHAGKNLSKDTTHNGLNSAQYRQHCQCIPVGKGLMQSTAANLLLNKPQELSLT